MRNRSANKQPPSSRAAIYSRDVDPLICRETSENCRRFLLEDRLEEAATYEDAGVGGFEPGGGPALSELFEAAGAGKFGTLVVQDLESLSCHPQILAMTLSRFDSFNVRVVTLEEVEHARVSRRYRGGRSRDASVEGLIIPTHLPFGYVHVGMPDVVAMHPARAEVASEILGRLARGERTRLLVQRFQSIPQAVVDPAHPRTVTSIYKMARSDIYIGRLTRRTHVSGVIVTVEVPRLRLVSDDVLYGARKTLRKRMGAGIDTERQHRRRAQGDSSI